MAKSIRFATTVSTRNLIHSNGFDGFYLDGRISGPRDSRMGETTLDREDRGFFYAIYTNSGSDIKHAAFKNKRSLDKIFEDLKLDNKYNIDYEINELADCAVNIAGRPNLTNEINPYFAGVIVKDGELAAITSGRACAYLYRDDKLYPLTQDEFPISDIDLKGNKVPQIDLYCAGQAGTIRYSNIAQLQADDCFILTNRDVMETMGSMGLLKLLDEAYDQQDAACKVYDIMAEQNPDATVQFMIGFVENINTLDKAAIKSLTGRINWTQKTLNGIGGLSALSQVDNPQFNQLVNPQASSMNGYKAMNVDNNQQTFNQVTRQNAYTSEPLSQNRSAVDEGLSQTKVFSNAQTQKLNEAYSEKAIIDNVRQNTQIYGQVDNNPAYNQARVSENLYTGGSSQAPIIGSPSANKFKNIDKDINEFNNENYLSTGKKAILAFLVAVVCVLLVAVLYFAYTIFFNTGKVADKAKTNIVTDSDKNFKKPDLVLPSDKKEETNTSITDKDTSKDKDNGDISEATQKAPSIDKNQNKDKDSGNTGDSNAVAGNTDKDNSSANSNNAVSNTDSSSANGNSSANTSGNTNSNKPKIYVVKANDTLWGIAMANGAGYDINYYLDLLVKANPESLPNGLNSYIEEGMELVLPQ